MTSGRVLIPETMLLAYGAWRNFEAVLFRYRCFAGQSDILLRCVCMCFTLECFGIGLVASQEWLELVEGATVAEVLNVYRERLTDFAWDSIAVAVNQEYAKAEDWS